MKKVIFLFLLAFLGMKNVHAQQTLVLADTGNSTSAGRAPQGVSVCNRTVYLIKQSEMEASGFVAGDLLSEIGFVYSVAQDIPTTSTTFELYFQNTSDTFNIKGANWGAAIVGMTQVRDINITIPASTGIFTIPFSGSNTFTYTGGSIYVAFDYQNTANPRANSLNFAACNINVPSGARTYQSATTVGSFLSGSNLRPQTYFTKVCANPTDNTTTVSACGSYTWANNGETYTSTGVYTGTTTNCVTEKLDLTIIDPAANFSFEGINYVVTSPTTVAVSNNAGASGDVAIPASVTTACGTYAVTSIGYQAFLDCTGLTSVTIPNTLMSISDYAFNGCSALTSVNIPNSVTSIGHAAFASCLDLTSVNIPNSVTNIADYTFAGCSALTSVTLPNSVISIGDSAFASCSGLTSVTIPNSVISIGDSAFSSCYNLISVIIPNSVTSIGNNAFYNCSGLTSVIIPNSITSISSAAFAYCSSLTSVTIPNSVTIIGGAAFQGCSGLTSVTIPISVNSIGEGAFSHCTGLTSITIPNSVTNIGPYAFLNCIGLISVTIPNSIMSIGEYAFYSCNSLTSVICNITIPLSINAFFFEGVNQGACSLTVPAGSIAAYQAAAVWQNFNPIKSNIPSTLSFCAGAKVADAVGTSTLKFYSALTGGSVLAATTALVTKTYYATITLNGIASTPRVPVAVTINTLPSAVAAVTASDTALCKYIGTTNTVTYTATPGASSYLWTVPAGVTIVDGQGTNMLTVDFHTATTSGASTIGNISVKAVNASGCPSALAKSIALSTKLPTAPSKVELTYNGVVKTKVGNYVGDESKALVLTATDNSNTAAKYTWDLPAGTSIVSGNASTDKTITIHLGSVAAGNTNLVFKAYSIGGCGSSIAKSLVVSRTAPVAPTALSLTNDAIVPTTRITNVSAYTGKFSTTPLTLKATPSTTVGAEATSYKWVLPSGIAVVDGNVGILSENSGFTTYTSVANAIQINLSGVGTATSLLLKVYGVNGNGQSILSKNLTLTSAIPAKPGILTTASGSTATYHPTCVAITVKVPNVFGVAYTWSVKDGAIANVLSTNSDGNEATINVSQLPAIVNSSFKIGVAASNGTGSSETIYTIRLGSACSGVMSKTADIDIEIVANKFNVVAYPNPSNNLFNFKVNGANDEMVSMLVFDLTGRQIENKVVNATDIENISLGQNYSTGVYNVIVSQGMNSKTVRLVKQ